MTSTDRDVDRKVSEVRFRGGSRQLSLGTAQDGRGYVMARNSWWLHGISCLAVDSSVWGTLASTRSPHVADRPCHVLCMHMGHT